MDIPYARFFEGWGVNESRMILVGIPQVTLFSVTNSSMQYTSIISCFQ